MLIIFMKHQPENLKFLSFIISNILIKFNNCMITLKSKYYVLIIGIVNIRIFYFINGNSWIPPIINKKAPNIILVVGLVKGILLKSNSFFVCLIPRKISNRPINIRHKPISQGITASIFKLFINNYYLRYIKFIFMKLFTMLVCQIK